MGATCCVSYFPCCMLLLIQKELPWRRFEILRGKEDET